ncbi:uncharacterized protein LOC128709069 [Anopheles marshallii]|uniref:uncharacterized protein LOC128709069 n=1 Tax=Anopheles marshallii TaxID=1521116 RepID=UPI00237B1BBD|nr:uncharacterized protein LOC128709069 [Anopheles marshallii]
MDIEETVCVIQQLPFEMLCKIFDYLDIWSVKECSRTCRRWQKTIFSDYYIKRFRLSVMIPAGCETLNLIQKSDRLYCNMDIMLDCNLNDSNVHRIFNGIYSVFCYPRLEQLVTLKIRIVEYETNSIRMIMNAIAGMKVLRELCLENWEKYGIDESNMDNLQIRSNSIQLLVLADIIPTLIEAPKLSSLRITTGPSVFSSQRLDILYEKQLFSWRIPSLKSLEIDKVSLSSLTFINNIEHVLRFLNNHAQLEKLNLMNVKLSGLLFKAICENCINLRELSIESLYIVDTTTLQNLSKLAKLRHLQLKNITCLEPVSFQTVRLPNLESLGIGSFPLHYETLDAFKSISKITILSVNTSTDFMTALAIKIPKLKQVELPKFSSQAIQSLQLLTSVEVLIVAFPITNLIRLRPGITTIKEIQCLVNCTPSSSDITILRTLYPTLQLITAGKNFKIRFHN